MTAALHAERLPCSLPLALTNSATEVKETQTPSELEWIQNMNYAEASFLCLGRPLKLDGADQYRLQHHLRLFCPLIDDTRFPITVDPAEVVAKGHGKNVSFVQITRRLRGNEQYELEKFFQRFEKAVKYSHPSGRTASCDEAWDMLRRTLWGLLAKLYEFMDRDYHDPRVLLTQRGPRYRLFRKIVVNGAPVFRKSTGTWPGYEIPGDYYAAVDNPEATRQYEELVEYNHAETDLPEREMHDTVKGPSEWRPPTELERSLLIEDEETTDREGGRQITLVPATEAKDGREPSRRIILDTGSVESVMAPSRTRANAGAPAETLILEDVGGGTVEVAVPPSLDRHVSLIRESQRRYRHDAEGGGVYGRQRSPLRQFPKRRASPIRTGTCGDVDGGTGTSPTVLSQGSSYNAAVIYPTGAEIILGGPGTAMTTHEASRMNAAGFDTNRRGNSQTTAIGSDVVATGTSWAGLETYFARYMPAAGTAIAVPHVGAEHPGDMAWRPTYRGHHATFAVPIFFPYEGARLAGCFNGKQTHDIARHLIDEARAGSKVDLFGYTFDHPTIAESLMAAARRGVQVTLTINAEEIEGKTSTVRASSLIFRMMGRCNDDRCGPESLCPKLVIRSARGSPLRPVYEAHGRGLSRYQMDRSGDSGEPRGAQHAKVLSVDSWLIIGSTNWTVASEANQELSALIHVEPVGARYQHTIVDDLSKRARRVSFSEMKGYISRAKLESLTPQERSEVARYMATISFPGARGVSG